MDIMIFSLILFLIKTQTTLGMFPLGLSLKCKTDILEEFSICNGNRKEQRMFKS